MPLRRLGKCLLFLVFLAGAFMARPSPLRSQVGGEFDLRWSTIDSGGAMRATGGPFELSGTIGQLDAGRVSGGGFDLAGGFWFQIGPGDCTSDGVTDLIDYVDLTDCFSGPIDGVIGSACLACFDFDSDIDVDMNDFAVFQNSAQR